MDIDFYFYEADIDRDGAAKLINAVQHAGLGGRKASKAVLFLQTNGGDPDAAYRIAKVFQVAYEFFDVAIPFQCKSAGTLIALGAHTLHFLPFTGELGPLDMQLTRHNELVGMSSSLIARKGVDDVQAMAFEHFENCLLTLSRKCGTRIATKTVADIAVKMTEAVFRPIMEQIDPMKLGEQSRSTEIAKAYGQRLNVAYANLKDTALQRLILNYPSHGFVIDWEEAMIELFHRVELFDPVLTKNYGTAVNVRKENGQIFFVGTHHDHEQQPGQSQQADAKSNDNASDPGAAQLRLGQEDVGRSDTTRGRISEIPTAKSVSGSRTKVKKQTL